MKPKENSEKFVPVDVSNVNQSNLTGLNISKTSVLEKSSHPTLNELLEDEMEDKFGRANPKVENIKNHNEKLSYGRQRADPELARIAVEAEKIIKKDGSKYSLFRSGITSI